MRVLFDGQIFSLQPYGGVNRYFNNLIDGLPPRVQPSIICTDCNESLPKTPSLKIHACSRFAFRPGRIALFTERQYFNAIANFSRADLIHATYYYMLLGKSILKLRRPLIVTLYDLLHEIFPEEVDRDGHHRHAKRAILSAATKIICISERTRRDLVEFYPELESRALVIPLALQSGLANLASTDRPFSSPYFLHVGQRWSYKNFPVLLRAFHRVSRSFTEVKLLLTGPTLTSGERESIASMNLTDRVVHYGEIGDEGLATLYRHSIALIYPSLYEGFGLPPLEAMSCGTTVICSSSSSMPEVVGDAAVLFDPRSVDELTSAMVKVYSSTSLRNDLALRGSRHVVRFNNENLVNATVRVYESAL